MSNLCNVCYVALLIDLFLVVVKVEQVLVVEFTKVLSDSESNILAAKVEVVEMRLIQREKSQ